MQTKEKDSMQQTGERYACCTLQPMTENQHHYHLELNTRKKRSVSTSLRLGIKYFPLDFSSVQSLASLVPILMELLKIFQLAIGACWKLSVSTVQQHRKELKSENVRTHHRRQLFS